jgi:crotonobetainyl-CoA:carnitine CoA-transferase CaiB-like acyl-CoA transferase
VHPTTGALRQVAAPLAGQVDATTLAVPDFADPHTDEVLAEVGIDAGTIAAWRAEGAIA